MTIVHPPSLDRDTDAIESLDFAPRCEYRTRVCEDTAFLVATFDPYPCGDPVRAALFCWPCWRFAITSARRCPTCFLPFPVGQIASQVLRVEFIRRVA